MNSLKENVDMFVFQSKEYLRSINTCFELFYLTITITGLKWFFFNFLICSCEQSVSTVNHMYYLCIGFDYLNYRSS